MVKRQKKIKVATYKQIQADVQKCHGRTVKTCWIAHVKELNRLSLRRSSKCLSTEQRKHPCPDSVRPLIEELMRRLGMLS